MILYHGTSSKQAKESIINNGFKICTDGNYGNGIYLTSHFELAMDYTYNDKDRKNHEELIIPVHIYNRDIKILQYKTLANRLGKICKKNPDFETALELPEVEEYARNNGIRALLIQYNYYDEIVVYDPSVIRKIG
ncbi:hypothetical protein [Romboutsia ilealis]|uniref:hypothetical protein n=1 Tax=Romboutsia ilealis TaxID=1115758 RepID=UPI0026F3E463|nr:hypothetical protein [Romboutsia ilealis]